MSKELEKSQFLLYSSDKEDIKIEVLLQDESLWLTQRKISELFDTTPQNITIHLKSIFEEGELKKDSTCKKFLQVQKEGERDVSRELEFYNLDVIIAVGYRVNSAKATQFRIWATQRLKEYIIKGFVLDDERLKQGERVFGKDYFKELLERIRSIRASERRIWQQITDIFAEISTDYNSKSQDAKDLFATIQNKFHYAITGKTAAEIVFENADHKKDNMGLKTWKNAPKGRILKSDSKIAKNYLDEPQIKKLERNVSSYFDYLENIIEQEETFTMKELAKSIDAFLNFNKFDILQGKGKKSNAEAEEKAEKEYDIFNKTQKIESDFDKFVKNIKK